MAFRKIDLLENEEIVFERGPVVLTNLRILANVESRARWGEPPPRADLRDIATCQKTNIGKQSQMGPGIKAGAAGIIVIALASIIPGLSDALNTALFLLGMVGVAIGVVLLVGNIGRDKARTTVLFSIPGRRNIAVDFPGWDSAEAAELVRLFTEAKRAL